MTGDIIQRNASISFDAFSGPRRARNHSFDNKHADDALARRQSVKYHFPLTVLEEAEIKQATISEEDIRRSVFGVPLSEKSFVAVEYAVWRPTTASCRRSVLWSRERRLYEAQSKQRLEEFKDRPYMHHEYPELKKHYPGTWRPKANKEELGKIVARLTANPAPTSASVMNRRRIKSAPPDFTLLQNRSAFLRRPMTSNTV